MVSTDPVADMLARIRNAIAVRKTDVTVPYSRLKEDIARLLKETNFIDKVSVLGNGIDKKIELVLSSADNNSRITEIARLSKPGRRLYVGTQDIPLIKRGRGVVIVSTSKGVMTGTEAKKQSVGGELICQVY